MFYLRYIAAELRRRKGRTVLTTLGLAVGVGLVVTVVALSKGLDNAQTKVLEPLTGVGTDMSVSRPLQVSGSGSNESFRPGGPGGAQLSTKEQQELRKENGGAQLGLQNLGPAGSHFSRDSFLTTDLSFPAAETQRVATINGVKQTAPALTLNLIHVSGKVPKGAQSSGFGSPAGGAGEPPNSINFAPSTISGVDVSTPSLALATPSQIIRGRYFGSGGTVAARNHQTVISQSYASDQRLHVAQDHDRRPGLQGRRSRTTAPGRQTSDIYLRLGILQKLSDHQGRVNVLRVRADSAGRVGLVSKAIKSSFPGSRVITAQDLANQVSGSLVRRQNLSGKLGTALAIVALAAAFLIASLLTLSSVNKRTRELGTLKALGWRQRLVIRQVTGESVAQGILGGVVGALLGIGGAALIDAFGPTLKATVAQATQTGGGFPGPPGGGFGQGAVQGGTSVVSLNAPVNASMIALAVALAVLGGLIAGAIGATRAARLRPAEALRSVE